MKKSVLLMVVALAAPALAEDAAPVAVPNTQAPIAQGDAAADTSYLDKVVCKKLAPPTGTRLGARKVCLTEREWRQERRDSQDYMKNQQEKAAGYRGPGGG